MIDAAAKLDVGIVGTFVGRDQTKNVPDNFREFRRSGRGSSTTPSSAA